MRLGAGIYKNPGIMCLCQQKALSLTYCFYSSSSLFDWITPLMCSFKLLLGDASYCTPEQYKDCAEPALGESAQTHNLMDMS